MFLNLLNDFANIISIASFSWTAFTIIIIIWAITTQNWLVRIILTWWLALWARRCPSASFSSAYFVIVRIFFFLTTVTFIILFFMLRFILINDIELNSSWSYSIYSVHVYWNLLRRFWTFLRHTIYLKLWWMLRRCYA